MSVEEKRFARVELLASAQDFKDGEQGLLGNVWFPPQEDSFAIDNSTVVLRYGFTEAHLKITDTRDSTYHNVRQIPLAEDATPPPFQRDNREAGRPGQQFVAQEIDKGIWRLSGCAHEDGILHGTIINMDGGPLCALRWEEPKGVKKPLKIQAKVYTQQRHLKAFVVGDDGNHVLANKTEREAVLQAVIAQTLRRNGPRSNDKTAELQLASDHCTASLHKAYPDER